MVDPMVYTPEPTLERFHGSDAFVRCVMGPVRSSKSTGMCMEIMRRAQEQAKGKNGKRMTRWLVGRSTYRELEDTTVKTWMAWFGPHGVLNKQTMTYKYINGDVDMEILFRAFERVEDAEKLLSLDLTGAWLNEAVQIPKGVVDKLLDRVGQYPAAIDGGCTWYGLMMDANPPDDDHWWHHLSEIDKPIGWEFFKQPGALVEVGGEFKPNPMAENIGNLNEGIDYYLRRIAGKSRDHIRVYYCGQYGFVRSGKPIIPEYVDAVHFSDAVDVVPGVPIYVGIDFGLTPAAVFGQRFSNGRWQWFDELVTEDMGAVRFAEALSSKIKREYQGYQFDFYGDPAGEQRAQTDERTPFMILNANGIPAKPAPTNDFTLRREAIAVPLSRLIDGKPGLMIGPKCVVTRKGLAGAYGYKRIQVAGDERFEDKPIKNKYSHPVEASGYMMIGAGEGNNIINLKQNNKPRLTAGELMRRYG